MAEHPWLTIIGLGEDGPKGLSPASLAALEAAEVVMGPPRHLSLLPDGPQQRIEWPVPFADGITQLQALRGRQIAVLASGDPFWYGAGSVIGRHFDRSEWTALPGLSCFSLAASHLGWPLEHTPCLGLHAAPLTQLRPYLAPGQRLLATLRDAAGPQALADYLVQAGFGESHLYIMESLGGPRERITCHRADALPQDAPFAPLLCVGVEVTGTGAPLPLASGRPDAFFEHDGQITKRPIRALTLSALAPRPGEHLWDIGGGSGSIGIEWLLTHLSLRATAIEADEARAARITRNAAALGVERLRVIMGKAPSALDGLERPDAVFIGGGLTAELLDHLSQLGSGIRLVANAVTLEAEALVMDSQARLGGTLLRIETAQAAPLGRKRGWRAAYPIVQWSVTL